MLQHLILYISLPPIQLPTLKISIPLPSLPLRIARSLRPDFQVRFPAGQYEFWPAVIGNQFRILNLIELPRPAHPFTNINWRAVLIVAVVFPEMNIAALVGVAPSFGCDVGQCGVEQYDFRVRISESIVFGRTRDSRGPAHSNKRAVFKNVAVDSLMISRPHQHTG